MRVASGFFGIQHRRSKPWRAAAGAGKLGVEPPLGGVLGEAPNYTAALMPMDQWPGEPIMIPASPLALRDRANITHLLLKRGTPSICAFREVMEAGALMSYGVNLVDVFRDIAAFVDQVARGSKAGDVPMRAPSHYHTAFNLKSATPLALALSPTSLARAGEVIE